MSTKTRYRVQCDCKKCNGKYVEERTRNTHMVLEDYLASKVARFVSGRDNCEKPVHISSKIGHDLMAEVSSSSKKKERQEQEKESTLFDDNYEPEFAAFIP